MKNRSFQNVLPAIAALTASVFFAPNLLAQNYTAGTSRPDVAPAASSSRNAPQLSYGLSQVLQLSRGKINDRTIIAYIQNSGTVYHLDASQIVYLKRQGVSDAVITAMINQRSRASTNAMQATSPSTNVNARSAQTATVVEQPATTYVPTVPSSAVYVVPDTQRYYYYSPYYYYPSYGYYGWLYPTLLFSFGYVGGYWHGYHGGYRHGGGGYYHGGGYRHGGGGYRHGGGGYRHVSGSYRGGGYRGGGGRHH